jgi:hypothetical protein
VGGNLDLVLGDGQLDLLDADLLLGLDDQGRVTLDGLMMAAK